MNKAMLSVTAIGLAGMLLVSFAATGKPPQTDSHATQGRGKAESCGGHQGPPLHARGGPNRKNTDAKASNCRGGKGQVSDADGSSSEKEGEMKTNGGVLAAALAMAFAATNVGATEGGISLFGCHTTSPRDPLVTPEVRYPRCYWFQGGSNNEICSPEIHVPSQTLDGNPQSDEYCFRLTSAGSGSTSIRQTDCGDPNKTGIEVSRSGSSYLVVELTKNGEPVIPHPIAIPQSESAQSLPFCVRTKH